MGFNAPRKCMTTALFTALVLTGSPASTASSAADGSTDGLSTHVSARVTEPKVSRQIAEDTAVEDTGPHAFGRALNNIRPEHWLPMRAGKRLFTQRFADDAGPGRLGGLGPKFNATSCDSCHFRDGRGLRSGFDGSQGVDAQDPLASPTVTDRAPILFRLSLHGGPDPVLGAQLQDQATAGHTAEGRVETRFETVRGTYADGEPFELQRPRYRWIGETRPHPQTLLSPRLAPTMIGMGLLEAVEQSELAELHDPEDLDGDGISGRLGAGRFGLKASQPDLRSQVTAALRHDMGVTGDEILTEHVDDLVLYLRLLAPPARRVDGAAPDEDPFQAGTPSQDEEILQARATFQAGETLFRELGCGSCHRETLTTGGAVDAAAPVETAFQRLRPYTDLLLHDMGPDLADVTLESAEETADETADGDGAAATPATPSAREWRTPPLWGLGLLPKVNGRLWLLHDGRARSFEEAILWHGGEALASREAFRRLSPSERRQLLHFLRSI